MNKNIIIDLLIAHGITSSKAQAQKYLQNKSDADLKQIYNTLKNKSVYCLLND